ncbi:MAG: hypothetical protein AVDCRST_MAG90-636, partial [uncultured Microvirga sp.]
SRLLDAFVERIEPLAARFRPTTRRVAIAESDRIVVYEVRTGQPPTRIGDSLQGDLKAGTDRKAARSVELRLPPDQVLHRTLQLPPAGKEFIEPIIENRLDRLTPWHPDKVLYGFRVVRDAKRDGSMGDGSMTVDFAATSADIAAEPIRRLQELGFDPTALGTAADPIEAPLQIDLYRGARSAARADLRRTTVVVLSIVMAVLGPACVGSFWFAHASAERLRAVEERLSQLRARLPSATGAKAEQARGRDRALVEAKRPETSLIVLIDGLSAALPAHTSLRELDIDGEKVRLAGRSRDAPALIGLLEQEEALAKVQFAAPVIRDSDNFDDFEIVAVRVIPQGEARLGKP